MRIMLLAAFILPFAGFGCEKQMGPEPVATDGPAASTEPADGEVDTDALRSPGSAGYFGALKGSRDSAERLKGKIDDYNRQIEEQADEVFDD